MSAQHTPRLPSRCWVERSPLDGLNGHQFAICSPFADGLPGTATLGFVAYRPHAELFAAAPELLEALQKVRAFAFAEREARGEDDETYDHPATDALGVIDRVIAKATGK